MITSVVNPRIKQVIQWQTKSRQRNVDQVFVAEGIKMYLEAPESLIREVYVAGEALERWEGDAPLMAKLSRTGYETVSEEVFAKMSDTRTPQGILAVMRQPEYRLDTLLQTPDPLFVVLERIQDPGNLGTILRTAEGAGVTGVIIDGESVDIFHPKVIRGTMGSVYRVPFVCEPDLLRTVERLHAAGVKTYAAHLRGRVYYDCISFRGGTAFLIGNEGNGLSRELAEAASSYIKIPMEGKLESLNAGVAAALLMYEAHRQRAVQAAD